MAPPTPPSDNNVVNEQSECHSNLSFAQRSTAHVEDSAGEPSRDKYKDFTPEEFEELLEAASDISKVSSAAYVLKIWNDLEAHHPEHTADRWRSFYERVVLPAYEQRREKKHQQKRLAEGAQQEPPAEVETNCNQTATSPNANEDAIATRTRLLNDENSTRAEESSIGALRTSREQAHEDVNPTSPGTAESVLSLTDQDSMEPSKKRSRQDDAESSRQGQHMSPAHKKKRLPSPRSSLKTLTSPKVSNAVLSSSPAPVQPQDIDLESDQEENDDSGRISAGADRNDPVRIHTAAEQVLSERDEPMGDEIEQRRSDDDGSSDSNSSFDVATLSAASRAMVGRRPKSASNSTQNTPRTISGGSHPRSARERFESLRNEYENSWSTTPDAGTPTKPRKAQVKRAGPSYPFRSTLEHRKQAKSSVSGERAECSGALPASNDEPHTSREKFDLGMADGEIEYPQLQGFSSQPHMQQNERAHREIFSEERPIDDDNVESDGQTTSALEKSVERPDEGAHMTGTVSVDDFFLQDQYESADESDSDYARRKRRSGKARAQSPLESNTQAFFDAQTQQPDLEFVEPPGGFEELPNFRANRLHDLDVDQGQEVPISSSEGSEEYEKFSIRPDSSMKEVEELDEDAEPLAMHNIDQKKRRQDSPRRGTSDVAESRVTESDTTPRPHARYGTVDTQAFFDSDSIEMMDLRLPSPNVPRKFPPLLSSPPIASSSNSTEQSQTTYDPETELSDLNEWIREMEEAGHQWNLIADALRATSFDTGLVLQILPGLESGHGIPRDMKGVWTDEDDEDLEGTDARRLQRLTAKHGWKLMDERRMLLQDWREGSDLSHN